MKGHNANRSRMAELLYPLTVGEGTRPSILDGVMLMRSDRSLPRMPVLYEPSIVIVAQGRKHGYLGDRSYTYDPDHYLVLSVPMPFECKAEVDRGEPFLAISIRIDLAVISELTMEMNHRVPLSQEHGVQGMCSTKLSPKIREATIRLLECLGNPVEAQVLGPQLMREVMFRVLDGPHGDSLRILLAMNGRLGQIQGALERIHANYFQPLDVAKLAEEAHMSVSAFHHNFKKVTTTSPVQYLKSIRLHKALMLIVQEGISAAMAAMRVGYESSSQFSREFKRFFGATPQDEAGRVRDMLGLDTPTGTRRNSQAQMNPAHAVSVSSLFFDDRKSKIRTTPCATL